MSKGIVQMPRQLYNVIFKLGAESIKGYLYCEGCVIRMVIRPNFFLKERMEILSFNAKKKE
jgi:hypothetical protein